MSFRILKDPDEPDDMVEPEPDYWLQIKNAIDGDAGEDN